MLGSYGPQEGAYEKIVGDLCLNYVDGSLRLRNPPRECWLDQEDIPSDPESSTTTLKSGSTLSGVSRRVEHALTTGFKLAKEW